MKKRLFVAAILLVTSQVSMRAWAQDRAASQGSTSAAAWKIVKYSGSLIGTAVATSGGCAQGFSNHCPSGHTCSCLTVTDAKFSSSAIGKGTANVFATIDQTASFGIPGACAPLYGEIDVSAKKDSPTFDVVGGECFEPNGVAVSNGVMGLAAKTNLFSTTAAGAYTATIMSSGLSGGGGRLTLSFKGAGQ